MTTRVLSLLVSEMLDLNAKKENVWRMKINLWVDSPDALSCPLVLVVDGGVIDVLLLLCCDQVHRATTFLLQRVKTYFRFYFDNKLPN